MLILVLTRSGAFLTLGLGLGAATLGAGGAGKSALLAARDAHDFFGADMLWMERLFDHKKLRTSIFHFPRFDK
jgi:hypothetical protein